MDSFNLRKALIKKWTISRCKNSYLAARYRRLVTQRGRKRAIVAIGHKPLLIACTLLQRGSSLLPVAGLRNIQAVQCGMPANGAIA
jgi:hypothetical protein